MTTKTIKLTLAAAAIAALTACGKSEPGQATGGRLGFSLSSSDETTSASAREIAKLRKLAASTDRSVAMTVAASTYIDRAVAFAPSMDTWNKLQLGAGAKVIKDLDGLRAVAEVLPADDPFKSFLQSKVSEVETLASAAAASAPASSAGAVESLAMKIIGQADAVMRARAYYEIASRGSNGWGVNTFDRSPMGIEFLQMWTRAHEVAVCVASTVGASMATGMTSIVFEDPAAAKKWGLRFAEAILRDQAVGVLSSCEEQYPDQAPRTIDGTGAKGSAWTVVNKDGRSVRIDCLPTGCEAVENGVQIYGKGQYHGVSYQLSFARATSQSAETSVGTRTGSSNTNSQRSDSTVGVGN